MKYTFDGFNWFIRLDKGDRLSDVFETFFAETDCQGAWVNGIGGAHEITLGHYSAEDKAHRWQTFTGFYEVTSMQGTVARTQDGKPIFHLHANIGDEQYQVRGGHVQDMVAGVTFELFIHRSYQPLKRRPESELGIQVLDV